MDTVGMSELLLLFVVSFLCWNMFVYDPVHYLEKHFLPSTIIIKPILDISVYTRKTMSRYECNDTLVSHHSLDKGSIKAIQRMLGTFYSDLKVLNPKI